jgi:hypothetical protein
MNAPASPIDVSTLTRLVTTALERTAFVMAEPSDENQPPDSGCIATRIHFSGAAHGECVLAATEGFVRELTAGFLGCEPDEVDVAVQGQDAMNELTNIVAGMVIRELGNATNRIFLGLPTHAALAAARNSPPAVACTLDSMGERLHICVHMHEAVAKAA